MGIFDSVMPGLASTLIGVFGNAATLRRSTGTYDPTTGDKPVTKASYPVQAAPPVAYSLQQVNGSTVVQGDVKVTIAAQGLAVTPVPGDVLIVGGVTYQVVTVNGKMAGDVPAAWELQCRK